MPPVNKIELRESLLMTMLQSGKKKEGSRESLASMGGWNVAMESKYLEYSVT
jgi:hypothetical protein